MLEVWYDGDLSQPEVWTVTIRDHSPFELGWMAGLMGDDPRLCPFEKMTKEWSEWQSAHGKATDFRRFANHEMKLS